MRVYEAMFLCLVGCLIQKTTSERVSESSWNGRLKSREIRENPTSCITFLKSSLEFLVCCRLWISFDTHQMCEHVSHWLVGWLYSNNNNNNRVGNCCWIISFLFLNSQILVESWFIEQGRFLIRHEMQGELQVLQGDYSLDFHQANSGQTWLTYFGVSLFCSASKHKSSPATKTTRYYACQWSTIPFLVCKQREKEQQHCEPLSASENGSETE